MSEASMRGVFNSKIKSFNDALKADDVDSVCQIGVEMLKIAFDECCKDNVNSVVKDSYRKQCLPIVNHLVNFAKRPQAAAGGGTGTSENGGDPYYVEKQWFSDEVPDLNFTDIIGLQEVKDAFMVDVVAPLRPEFQNAYRKFRGDQMGSQILLYGPPGTGKTFIVKCLGGVLKCHVAIVQTSEVLASVVGVAEKNIRDIFAQAAEFERCIIFFDEIDSICSDRDSLDSRNTKSILTTLLTNMDGFIKTKKKGQLRIIMAATNLPWKLDPALKRGGRFETQIYVPLPDYAARERFIEPELNRLPHDPDVSVEKLVNALDGFSGADIKAVLRQIANKPLRRAVVDIMNGNNAAADAERVTADDCDEVIKNYINGITPEMLMRFRAYEHGISYEDLVNRLREKQ